MFSSRSDLNFRAHYKIALRCKLSPTSGPVEKKKLKCKHFENTGVETVML
jgi:hypothetical protein